MESVSVRRGTILSPVFFFMKSIAPKSSVSSIATSSVSPPFLNATMLWLRAMGSGMSARVSKSSFCPLRFTNGMPSTYACTRRKSSSESSPFDTKISPTLTLSSLAFFSAFSKAARETRPASRINSFSCSSLMCIDCLREGAVRYKNRVPLRYIKYNKELLFLLALLNSKVRCFNGEMNPVRDNKSWYTYVLRSKKDLKWYTGISNDLRKRLREHNIGTSYSTKRRRPFELIYYEMCRNLNDARSRELFLKSGMGKRYLKNRLRRFLSLTG